MSDVINTLEIKSSGLGTCLSNNFLSIPKYQRGYSWDDDNVGDFLTDINTAFANNDAEYFMGSVVIQGNEQKFEVVDGQQRLTTASILIAAIRDFLWQKGHEKIADSLEERFLMTKDIWQQETRPRITLSTYDNDFFLKQILVKITSPSPPKPLRESHERLQKAKEKTFAFIENFANSVSNWLERLKGLVEFITHKVRVILVIVPSQTNAYVIFETLNDRGKDLSASDLLKNYLFGKAGDRIDEVQSKWNHMLGALELQGGDAAVITYIRQLWSATREVTREKELFAKIKEKIINVQGAVDFASELDERAPKYAAIINPSDNIWNNYGAEAQSIARTLNLLKLERYRPALLALICKFEKQELIKAMRYLLNGSVRYLIVVGSGGGTLEAAYAETARKVFSGEISNAVGFAKEMQKIIPNDATFRASFKSARSSKPFLARYYLSALERAAKGEKDCELIPNDDVTAVNLEHVLPENPGGNWSHVSEEIAAAYSRRLGNLALLRTKLNNEIGNDAFSVKRLHLAKSSFLLTSEIAKCQQWGPEQIEARQAALAEIAVSAWPYKF